MPPRDEHVKAVAVLLIVSLGVAACRDNDRSIPAPLNEPAPTMERSAPTETRPADTIPLVGGARLTETIPASAVTHTFIIIPEASEVRYEVNEEFFNRDVAFVNTVGRTNSIEGEFQLAVDEKAVYLQNNLFTVDLRTLVSDDSRRDSRLRDHWLQSNTFPYATFAGSSIKNFRGDAMRGEEVTFQLVGDMAIREVTQPVTFDVTAALEDNTLVGTATTTIHMTDYGFEPPDIMGMLRVENAVNLVVDFTAQALSP